MTLNYLYGRRCFYTLNKVVPSENMNTLMCYLTVVLGSRLCCKLGHYSQKTSVLNIHILQNMSLINEI